MKYYCKYCNFRTIRKFRYDEHLNSCIKIELFNKYYDSRYYLKNYFKKINGSILFVGVGSYTKDYYNINKNLEFITIDYMEERSKYGSKDGHYCEDFLNFDPKRKFDHICLFGVMGISENKKRITGVKYNLNNLDVVLNICKKLLYKNGTILFGIGYIFIPEQNLQYWENQFKKYKNDYIFLESFRDGCNVVALIKPKV